MVGSEVLLSGRREVSSQVGACWAYINGETRGRLSVRQGTWTKKEEWRRIVERKWRKQVQASRDTRLITGCGPTPESVRRSGPKRLKTGSLLWGISAGAPHYRSFTFYKLRHKPFDNQERLVTTGKDQWQQGETVDNPERRMTTRKDGWHSERRECPIGPAIQVHFLLLRRQQMWYAPGTPAERRGRMTSPQMTSW